ncbi:restriction endonuclease subunit S [Enterococcus avium]|uniref:Restriction endonuclease subunit S n=1 Tax=Enterococcus avium TaxID=33945 RepID=A0ABD5F817_ENTAV|nr:restriction endonuclease subunit S [Enterococcus avium]MDT2397776.1 restriction endonuclease subunit S [Enterococcus avium]MDT2435705.1 restriction endonuclease subunit S [Enterococcus avium]MDT2448621.1 restriction endonuclease subunit S [Enterococcus avium]MDT2466146.1 restriction endonuclease subunit S [Enterococcus avium]MDT2469882.1 restriction endonuclease subunit S [Enterococcus avium]
MENKKKPEIRFPTFEGDWEQRKLGESVKFLNGRAYKQQELLDIGKYRVLRVGNFNTNDKWYYSDLELEADKYANPGDLLYLWATSFGPEIWNEEKVIYHYHIWKLEIIDKSIDKEYLYTWLLTDKERIRQNTNGSTMVHVTKGNMEERRFEFPSDIIEQQKVGSFFRQLDDTITLHQQELTTLKQTKQGFLQKMFPKEGEKVPEVRFPEFTDEWEQCKLGDIFKKDTQKNKDLEFHSDSVISVAKMKLSPPSAKSSDEYMKTYNKIRKGNIAFEGHTNDEFPNGRFVLNDCQDGIVSHIYDVYSAVDEYNNEFMKRYINNPDVMRKILINATSSARMMKSLNSIEFLKQSILLPILSEQQKIGEFFYQLDNTLTLHQRELELLQLTKKAFLQKLFV